MIAIMIALAATHAHTPTLTAHSAALILYECPAARRASTANYRYCYCHTIRHKPEPCSTKHGQLHKQTLQAMSTPPSCPFHPAESINSEINGAPRCAQPSSSTTQHKPCYAPPAGSLQRSWGPKGSRLAAAALTRTPHPHAACTAAKHACICACSHSSASAAHRGCPGPGCQDVSQLQPR
jgi:hypothetical protein